MLAASKQPRPNQAYSGRAGGSASQCGHVVSRTPYATSGAVQYQRLRLSHLHFRTLRMNASSFKRDSAGAVNWSSPRDPDRDTSSGSGRGRGRGRSSRGGRGRSSRGGRGSSSRGGRGSSSLDGRRWDGNETGGEGERRGGQRDGRPGGNPRGGASAPPSGRGSRAARRPNPDEPPGVLELNHELRDATSSQQLLQALQNHSSAALTAFNVATAWVRLGNLHSKRPPIRAAAAAAGSDGDDDIGAAEATCAAAVRHLLEPTAAAAPGMDVRQIANSLWGMAKVGDGILRAASSRGNGPDTTADEALQLLQQRAVTLLQQLVPLPRRQAGSGSDDLDSAGDGRKRRLLDQRDATQLWYGMAALTKLTWSDAMNSALEEVTLLAMEAGLVGTAPAGGESSGREGGRGAGGHSGRDGNGWVGNPTVVAQIVFRMAAVSGAKMSEGHKARLAEVIDSMSYDNDDDSAAAGAPTQRAAPLENPDCLLVAAHLLRLELPPAAVRRLHDMALALPPAAAARTGRTAMARALNSATQLGVQPSAAQARRWQQRLLAELGGARDGGWTSEGLSWTMLALSHVKAYLPDADARGELLGALRPVVRQMRANDASRVQQALKAWGLQLPEREAALLRQKASAEAWTEVRDGSSGGGGGGGGGSRGYVSRSWGFAR